MRASLSLAAFVLLSVLGAGAAHAYPQFQLSTENVRCNQCHYAPAGGGVLRQWGREEAADQISGGGDGAFLHGAWEPPDWLVLGGDLRGVVMVNEAGGTESPALWAFPMQAELYSLFRIGQAWTVSLTLGSSMPFHNAPLPVFSREHWVMWQPAQQGPYVRMGRFLSPHGLRMAEHPSFVRRYMGLHVFEETYDVSGGWIYDDWELHVTAFTPDFLLPPVGWRGRGITALYERRAGDDLSFGLQSRVGWSSEDNRYAAGGIGKYWLEGPRVLLSAELNLVFQTFEGLDGASRGQAVSFLGASWFPVRGVMLQGAWEHFDPDMAVRAVARDAATVQAHWFPTAHVELLFYGRVIVAAAGEGGDTASLAMLQLHYYL